MIDNELSIDEALRLLIRAASKNKLEALRLAAIAILSTFALVGAAGVMAYAVFMFANAPIISN